MKSILILVAALILVVLATVLGFHLLTNKDVGIHHFLIPIGIYFVSLFLIAWTIIKG